MPIAVLVALVLMFLASGNTVAQVSKSCTPGVFEVSGTLAENTSELRKLVNSAYPVPGNGQFVIFSPVQGGLWTVDNAYKFIPFTQVFPTAVPEVRRSDNFLVKSVVLDGESIFARSLRGDIYLASAPNFEFKQLAIMQTLGFGPGMGLLRDEGTDKVYLSTARRQFEVSPEGLEQSAFDIEARALGLRNISLPIHIPYAKAHLFYTSGDAPGSRQYAGFWVRFNGGNWKQVHQYFCRGKCEALWAVDTYNDERFSVVRFGKSFHTFSIEGDRVEWDETFKPTDILNEPQVGLARARNFESLGKYIWFSERAATAARSETHLVEVTKDGLKPVPGEIVTHRASMSDLVSINRLVLDPARNGEQGLIMVDGAQATLIPNSTSQDIGEWASVIDARALGRAFIASELGLFELFQDGRIEPLETPINDEDLTEFRKFQLYRDLPDGSGGIFILDDGVLQIDKSGETSMISTPEGFEARRRSTATAFSENGRMLISGERSLFILDLCG